MRESALPMQTNLYVIEGMAVKYATNKILNICTF